MTILYSHKQFGRGMFFFAIAVAVLIGAVAAFFVFGSGARLRGVGLWVSLLVPGVTVFGMLLVFTSLRVTVTDTRVAWQFGAGFLNYSTPIRDVVRVETVHPSLIYGIGIRLTPQGWLYNVGAGNAVAITTAKKTVLIGTDDPTGLIQAIEAARGLAGGGA